MGSHLADGQPFGSLHYSETIAGLKTHIDSLRGSALSG